jgi:hypothetical protein
MFDKFVKASMMSMSMKDQSQDPSFAAKIARDPHSMVPEAM